MTAAEVLDFMLPKKAQKVTYQRLSVFCLHSLIDSDHDDGGSGRTADQYLLTTSTASRCVLAFDSVAGI